jgi:type II secretion system protein G
MKTARHRSHRQCFTLIEVLATMAIIMVLAGLALGVATAVTRNAAEARTKARLEAMTMALQEFFQDRGYYPQQAAGDANFGAFRHSQTNRPYMEGVPEVTVANPYLDAWQRPFQYKYEAGDDHYRLWSTGRDKASGTEDDICSWKKR